MSDTVISVDQLCKSYWIKHQLQGGRKQGQQYERFSEVLTRAISAPFRRRNAEEVAASREEFWALQDVSFEVKRGEVLGIIGRNGAGKSTLLKVLSRITEPTSGRVEIDGRVASLLEVGTGFHPELTGRENVFLNGAILGMSRVEIKRKFDEIVAFAEVEKFLDTPVKRYSSGMYVRLAFAVAAHLEPEILIVDEVLAVGDVQFQKKCLGKMQEITQNDGRTILFVSHNLDSILRLTTRTIWLEKGRIKCDALPTETISAYHQNLHDVQPVIILSERKRFPHLLRNLELAAVEFSGSAAKPWIYGFGEDLTFRCRLRVNRPVGHFIFGYAIFNATGVEIASTRIPLHLPAGMSTGDCTVVLSLPGLRLTPGNYALNLGIHSNLGDEDFVDVAARFDVVTNQLAAELFADTIRAASIPTASAEIFRSA